MKEHWNVNHAPQVIAAASANRRLSVAMSSPEDRHGLEDSIRRLQIEVDGDAAGLDLDPPSYQLRSLPNGLWVT